MFCSRCGKKVKDGSSFCPNCGQRITAGPKSEISSDMGEQKGKGIAWKVGICLAAAGATAVISFGAVWLAGILRDQGKSGERPDYEDSLMVSDQRGSKDDNAKYRETYGTSAPANSGQEGKDEAAMPAETAGFGESESAQAGLDPGFLESEGMGAYEPAMIQEPEFILPEGNVRYITYKDIQGLDETALRIAKNEIYARHGRLFQSEDLSRYFHSKSWYQGTIAPNDFSERVFNQFETANVALLAAFQNGIQDGEYHAHDFMILHFQMSDGILTAIAEDDHWGNNLKGFAFSLPVSSHCNWWYVNENRGIEGKDAELRRIYEERRAEYLDDPDMYASPTGVVILVQGGMVVEVRQYNP